MNKEFKIGDVVKVNTHRYGTNTGNYGTFNVEKVTPSQIHVYDHNTKEVMKFLKHSKRGIGEHSNMMLEEVEEKLDERTGYGELRHADFNFANSEPVVTKVQKKFYVKTKAGKIVSTHSNALDAVKARAKIGDHTTHSIVKEEVEELDEAHVTKLDEETTYESATSPEWDEKRVRQFTNKKGPNIKKSGNTSLEWDKKRVKQFTGKKIEEEVEPIDETAYSPPRKDADPYDEDDYAPGINRDIKTEKPRHKVGDTVYASSSTNKALTMTGKVTKIGHTLTTVKHKDGSEANYPHKLVSKEYSDLHTDPAKKYKQFQREHLEQTGELLTLTEVKYILENSAGGAGVIAQHAGINGNAPAGTGKVKKMMGNKTDATAIAKIIVNGTNLKESN